MTTDYSRRDFLKGAGLAAVGAASMGALSGCSQGADGSAANLANTAEDWMPETWDYECDFLVIGYGGSGLWAALTAADEGGAEVLCLEKAPVRGGGNSSINMGEFTWTDDVDGCVQYIKNFSKGLVPEASARAWAEECTRNCEYVEKWGAVAFKLEGSQASGFKNGCELPELDTAGAMHVARISEDGNGADGWAILDEARADLGVEVLFDCHDEELIQNPLTKEILGCYTLIGDDGKKYAVKARKGTLLSTGGFEHNEEMHANYLKCYPARGFYGWPFNTGDGHQMAMAVGAKLWNMREMIGSTTTNFPNNDYKYAIMASPHTNNYLHVDRLGQRFANEMGGFDPHNGWHPYTKFNDDFGDFERIPSWIIFDKTGFEGGPLGPEAQSATMQMWLDGLPEECGAYQGWSEDNSVEVEKGWIKKGDTLEELVASMADPNAFVDDMMDVETLKASVARYNELCKAGEDTDFGRPADAMLPVDNPPYYAMPFYPGGCTTLGGPKKNENAQVLDGKDEVIPRLYASGSISNFQAHTYGISGGGNAENMIWGRISARHACSLEPWDTAEAE